MNAGVRPPPVLICGGSGFIGARLTGVLLERGIPVRVFDVRKPDAHGVEYVQGDVRDAADLTAAMQGIETVFQLAAVHRDDVREADLYYAVNVQGMQNVLTACTAAGVHRIVFTSTVACYGLDAGSPDERAPLAPFNDYGRSKCKAEEILLEWASRPGNHAVIVRPSVVFGERNRGNVYNLLRQIRRGTFPMVGEGSNRKSMAYVGNIADFLAWLHENVRTTEIYNYADKPDLTTLELVRHARGAMGLTGDPLRIPYSLAIGVGGLCDMVSTLARTTLPFSRIRVVKFCADTTIDAAKAHASGFTARYSLEDALRRTIRNEFTGEPATGTP